MKKHSNYYQGPTAANQFCEPVFRSAKISRMQAKDGACDMVILAGNPILVRKI